jgi:hypothetical protein
MEICNNGGCTNIASKYCKLSYNKDKNVCIKCHINNSYNRICCICHKYKSLYRVYNTSKKQQEICIDCYNIKPRFYTFYTCYPNADSVGIYKKFSCE